MVTASRSIFAATLRGAFALLSVACSAPDPKEVKSSTSDAPLTECATTQPALTLQNIETPGYNNAIKTILNNSCAVSGCHVAGGSSIDLSTYALASADAANSKARMDSAASPMPPGGQLNQATRDLFTAWINAGTPENDTLKEGADDGSETTGGATGGGASDSGESTAPPAAPTNPASTGDTGCVVKNEQRTVLDEPDFDYLLKSADVKTCHDAKKIYDRNAKTCGTATLDLSWCSRIGIFETFRKINMNTTAVLDKALGSGKNASDIGDGFLIDQCGIEPSGAPVVFFIRLVKPPEVPGLKVRLLSVDTTKGAKVAETADE